MILICVKISLADQRRGRVVRRKNDQSYSVAQRWARLVLGWVTVFVLRIT